MPLNEDFFKIQPDEPKELDDDFFKVDFEPRTPLHESLLDILQERVVEPLTEEPDISEPDRWAGQRGLPVGPSDEPEEPAARFARAPEVEAPAFELDPDMALTERFKSIAASIVPQPSDTPEEGRPIVGDEAVAIGSYDPDKDFGIDLSFDNIKDFYFSATTKFLSDVTGADRELVSSGAGLDDIPEMDSPAAQAAAEFMGSVAASLTHLSMAKSGLGPIAKLPMVGGAISQLPGWAQAGGRLGSIFTGSQAIRDVLHEDEQYTPMDYTQTFLAGFAGGTGGHLVSNIALEMAVNDMIPDSAYPLISSLASGATKGAGITGIRWAFDPEETQLEDLGLNMATMAIWSTMPLMMKTEKPAESIMEKWKMKVDPETGKFEPGKIDVAGVEEMQMKPYNWITGDALSKDELVSRYKAMQLTKNYVQEQREFMDMAYDKLKMQKPETLSGKEAARDYLNFLDRELKKVPFREEYQKLDAEEREFVNQEVVGALTATKYAENYLDNLPWPDRIKMLAKSDLSKIVENTIQDIFSSKGVEDVTIDTYDITPKQPDTAVEGMEARPALMEAEKLTQKAAPRLQEIIQLGGKVVDFDPTAMPGEVDIGEAIHLPDDIERPAFQYEEGDLVTLEGYGEVEIAFHPGPGVALLDTETGEEVGVIETPEELDALHVEEPTEVTPEEPPTEVPEEPVEEVPEEPIAEVPEEPTVEVPEEPVEKVPEIEPVIEPDIIEKQEIDIADIEEFDAILDVYSQDEREELILDYMDSFYETVGKIEIAKDERDEEGLQQAQDRLQNIAKDIKSMREAIKQLGIEDEISELGFSPDIISDQDLRAVLPDMPVTRTEPVPEEPEAEIPEDIAEPGPEKPIEEMEEVEVFDERKHEIIDQVVNYIDPAQEYDHYIKLEEPDKHFAPLLEDYGAKLFEMDAFPEIKGSHLLELFRYKPGQQPEEIEAHNVYSGRKHDWHAFEGQTGEIIATGSNIEELRENVKEYFSEYDTPEKVKGFLRDKMRDIGPSPRWLQESQADDLYDTPEHGMFDYNLSVFSYYEKDYDFPAPETIETPIDVEPDVETPPEEEIEQPLSGYTLRKPLEDLEPQDLRNLIDTFKTVAVSIDNAIDAGKSIEDMPSIADMQHNIHVLANALEDKLGYPALIEKELDKNIYEYEIDELKDMRSEMKKALRDYEDQEERPPGLKPYYYRDIGVLRDVIEDKLKARADEITVDVTDIKPIGEGIENKVITPRESEVNTHFALVEADDLIASHDINLIENPEFPKEAQPRERGKIASEEQVSHIEAHLDPARLGITRRAAHGAPIIGKDGVVEVGNARTIALKRLYEAEHENVENYKGWLAERAEQFGLDPADVMEADKPVLVRVRDTEVDRAEWVVEANLEETASMSSAEQGQVDAQMMPEGYLQNFYPDKDGNIDTAANQSFISEFMRDIVGVAERGEYFDEYGNLNYDGIKRIQAAVFMKAYDDIDIAYDLLESDVDNIKRITKSMMRAAPKVAKMQEAIDRGERPELDISQELVDAVKLYKFTKREGFDSVEQWESQLSLFDDGPDDFTVKLAKILDINKRSGKRIFETLYNYYQGIEDTGIRPNNMSLAPEMLEAPTKEDLLSDAYTKMMKDGEYDPEDLQYEELFEPVEEKQRSMFARHAKKEREFNKRRGLPSPTEMRPMADWTGNELSQEEVTIKSELQHLRDDTAEAKAQGDQDRAEYLEGQKAMLRQDLEDTLKELAIRRNAITPGRYAKEGYEVAELEAWLTKKTEFDELLEEAEMLGIEVSEFDYDIPALGNDVKAINKKFNDAIDSLREDISAAEAGTILDTQLAKAESIMSEKLDIELEDYTNLDEIENTMAQLRVGNIEAQDILDLYEIRPDKGNMFGDIELRSYMIDEILGKFLNPIGRIKVDVDGYGELNLPNDIKAVSYLLERLGLTTEFEETEVTVGEGDDAEDITLERAMNKRLYDVLTDTQANIESQLKQLADFLGRKKSTPVEERDPEYFKPVTRIDIEEYMANVLETPFRYGRISNARAEATYNAYLEVIRSRKPTQMDITSHEIGHHLVNTLDLDVHKFPGLVDVLEQSGLKDYYPEELWHQEGAAEFFKDYFNRPSVAESLEPNFYRYVEGVLAKNPEIAEKVKGWQDLMRRWFGQTGLQRATSNIKERDPEGLDLLGAKGKIYNAIIDDFDVVLRGFEHVGADPGKHGIHKDPEFLYNLFHKFQGKFNAYIEKAQFDFRGEVVGPPIAEILAPVIEDMWVDTDRDPQIGPFNQYVVHRAIGERVVREIQEEYKGSTDEEDIKIYEALDEAIAAGDLDAQIRALKSAARQRDYPTAVGIHLDDIVEAMEFVKQMDLENPHYLEVLDQYEDAKRNLLDYAADAGLMSHELAEQIKEKYPYHQPLHRFFGESEQHYSNNRNKSLVNLSPAVRSFYGSDRIILDPLSSLIQDMRYLMYQSDKNYLATRIIETMLAGDEPAGQLVRPVPDKLQIVDVPLTHIKDSLFEAGLSEEEIEELDLDVVAKLFRHNQFLNAKDAKENVVSVVIGGERQLFEMHPQLYRFMRGMEELQAPTIDVGPLRTLANLFKKGAVAVPSFWLGNVPRDAGRIFNYKDTFISIPFKEFGKGLLNFVEASPEQLERLETTIHALGLPRSGFSYYIDQPDLSDIDKLENLIHGGFEVRKLNPLYWGGKLTEKSELATRKGLFHEKLEEYNYFNIEDKLPPGLKAAILSEAALYASDTVLEEYARTGWLTREFGFYVPFLSAQMAGFRQMIKKHKLREGKLAPDFSLLKDTRTLNEEDLTEEFFIDYEDYVFSDDGPKQRIGQQTFTDLFLKRFASGVLMLALPAMGLYFLNRDKKYYQELHQSIKDYNYIIPVPDAYPDGLLEDLPDWVPVFWQRDEDFIRIRKPFQPGLVYSTIPERILEYIDTRDPEKLTDLAKALGRIGFPSPVPAHVVPWAEVLYNRATFGGDIVPPHLSNIDSKYQYDESTSEFAKLLGRTNFLNISPMEIDHILRGTMATAGQDIINITDMLVGEASVAETIALSSGLYRRGLEHSNSVARLYREANKAEQIINTTEHELQVERLDFEAWEAGAGTYEPEDYYRALIDYDVYESVAAHMADLNRISRDLKDFSEGDVIEYRGATVENEIGKEAMLDAINHFRINFARVALSMTGKINYPGEVGPIPDHILQKLDIEPFDFEVEKIDYDEALDF